MGKILRYLGATVLVVIIVIFALGLVVASTESDLHAAAWYGDTAEAKRLIDNGVDINEANWMLGEKPLHMATEGGHTEIALALIKAGADINARDGLGNTPLHYAAEEGHAEIALALVKAGADLHARNDGITPLDVAIDEHGKDSDIALALQNTAKK